MRREKERERDGQIDGWREEWVLKATQFWPPTLLRSSFNSFAVEWLLSLYFYTLSINRPPQTHLCSLTKWQMDTCGHTHTHSEKYTITDVDNDWRAAKLLRVTKRMYVCVCIFFNVLFCVCALHNLLQMLQITCCPAVWTEVVFFSGIRLVKKNKK